MRLNFIMASSKIPIRDLKPMFNTMERNQRKETFSASFNPPPATASSEVRSKSVEKTHKICEKNKELKHLVGHM